MPARDRKCRAYKLRKRVRDTRYRRAQEDLGWYIGCYVAYMVISADAVLA